MSSEFQGHSAAMLKTSRSSSSNARNCGCRQSSKKIKNNFGESKCLLCNFKVIKPCLEWNPREYVWYVYIGLCWTKIFLTQTALGPVCTEHDRALLDLGWNWELVIAQT